MKRSYRDDVPSVFNQFQDELLMDAIGKKSFGRKGGFTKLTFGDDCLMMDDITCRKL